MTELHCYLCHVMHYILCKAERKSQWCIFLANWKVLNKNISTKICIYTKNLWHESYCLFSWLIAHFSHFLFTPVVNPLEPWVRDAGISNAWHSVTNCYELLQWQVTSVMILNDPPCMPAARTARLSNGPRINREYISCRKVITMLAHPKFWCKKSI